MDSHTDHLDSQELLHLALVASQAERHDHAIALLKQAWQRSPGDANIVYCLGAEHAQIGMYERAIDELAHAIELDPSLDTARLQLGILCLTCGMADRGVSELTPLVELPENHCCRHFANALIALANDRTADCVAYLDAGLALTTGNAALIEDMRRLRHAVQQQTQGDPKPVSGERARDSSPQSLWLSSYKKNGTHPQ